MWSPKRGPLGQYTPVCRIWRPWRSPTCKLYSTEEKNCIKSILRVSNVRTTSYITYSLHHVMCHTHLMALPLLYFPRLKIRGILIRLCHHYKKRYEPVVFFNLISDYVYFNSFICVLYQSFAFNPYQSCMVVTECPAALMFVI